MSVLLRPPLQARASLLDAYSAYTVLDLDFGYGRGSKLLDKSPFHSHGDILGASWATGVHGYTLDFNAATPDYVEIPAAYTQLNFTSENFSLIARVKLDNLSDANRIFIRGLFDTDGWFIQYHTAVGLDVRTGQSSANQSTQSGTSGWAIATWYTIGFSRDGASITLYRNGVDVTSVSGVHINPATSSRSAKIAVDDDKSGNPFDGQIEFLRIFGRIALPATAHAWFHNMLK